MRHTLIDGRIPTGLRTNRYARYVQIGDGFLMGSRMSTLTLTDITLPETRRVVPTCGNP